VNRLFFLFLLIVCALLQAFGFFCVVRVAAPPPLSTAASDPPHPLRPLHTRPPLRGFIASSQRRLDAPPPIVRPALRWSLALFLPFLCSKIFPCPASFLPRSLAFDLWRLGRCVGVTDCCGGLGLAGYFELLKPPSPSEQENPAPHPTPAHASPSPFCHFVGRLRRQLFPSPKDMIALIARLPLTGAPAVSFALQPTCFFSRRSRTPPVSQTPRATPNRDGRPKRQHFLFLDDLRKPQHEPPRYVLHC